MGNDNNTNIVFSLNKSVAFLDILGFKEICKHYTATVIGQTLHRAVTSAILHCKEMCEKFHYTYSPCEIITFSDSLAIFSQDESIHGFRSVVLHVKHIMQNLLVHQFPIRGAIAFGDIYLNKDPTVFVGDGYDKCVNLEKIQNWIGVAIHDSVENKFFDYFQNDLISEVNTETKLIKFYNEPSIIKYRVPMKDGTCEFKYTVNWLDGLSYFSSDNKKINHSEIIEMIKRNTPPDKASEIKYLHTIEYINYINSIILIKEDGTQQHIVPAL